MTWSDRLALLGLAAATIVPAMLLGVKAASFRGDMHKKWRQRSGLCAAALEDRASRRIRKLRDEAIKLIGEPGAPFEPKFALADPKQLAKYVKEFQDAIALHSNLDRWVKWMLRFAGLAPFALALYVIGGLDITVYYAKWWEWRPALPIGCVIAAVGLSIGAVVLVMHYYFDRRLSSAEIIANEEDPE